MSPDPVIDEPYNPHASLAVIGLGYVGLPLVLAFGRKMPVTGFDVNAARVAALQQGTDPTGESSPDKFRGITAHFTTRPDDLRSARIFIVAVPTPVDEHNVPQLDALRSATETVGKALKRRPGHLRVHRLPRMHRRGVRTHPGAYIGLNI